MPALVLLAKVLKSSWKIEPSAVWPDLQGEAKWSDSWSSWIPSLHELSPRRGYIDHSRLDRLARSVVHLAKLAKRFQNEKIDLLVLDQNIDTSTSTGRLMFNMLACIAEFENDLRTERQTEGIAKARENGVRFGRPPKLTDSKKKAIYSRRQAGASIGQLVKEFKLGEATIYRALAAVGQSEIPPSMKTTKVNIWLQVENNNNFVRGKGKSRQAIEDFHLSRYQAKKLDKNGWEYELTFCYENDEDLEKQIYDLATDINQEADLRNGFVECDLQR